MKLNAHTLAAVVALATTSALAQQQYLSGKVAPATDAKGGLQLACPAGARQVGGPTSMMEATGCVKFGRDGSRVFHGPYVAFWQGGAKQAEGQYDEGFRSGRWAYFDEKGVKTGETNFKMGDYDGVRVEFWSNGQKKLEETYVAGRRQGAQRMFDQTGKLMTQTDYVDDRPVAAAK